MNEEVVRPGRQRGFLGFVERAGNLLPEPAMIFVWLIGILMVLSAIASWAGLSASLNYTGKEAPQWGELENGVLTYRASSLFNEENIARLLTEMPRTMSSVAPLGLVLVMILGRRWPSARGCSRRLSAPRSVMRPRCC